MIYMVPFAAEHYGKLELQPAQNKMCDLVTTEGLAGLEGPYSSTIMEDGKPIAFGGALAYTNHRALVWSFLSNKVNAHNFRQVHAFAKQGIEGMPFKRLEMSVDVGFEEGHRWARALGFEMETPLQRAFQVDGSDSVGYVRIR